MKGVDEEVFTTGMSQKILSPKTHDLRDRYQLYALQPSYTGDSAQACQACDVAGFHYARVRNVV